MLVYEPKCHAIDNDYHVYIYLKALHNLTTFLNINNKRFIHVSVRSWT